MTSSLNAHVSPRRARSTKSKSVSTDSVAACHTAVFALVSGCDRTITLVRASDVLHRDSNADADTIRSSALVSSFDSLNAIHSVGVRMCSSQPQWHAYRFRKHYSPQCDRHVLVLPLKWLSSLRNEAS